MYGERGSRSTPELRTLKRIKDGRRRSAGAHPLFYRRRKRENRLLSCRPWKRLAGDEEHSGLTLDTGTTPAQAARAASQMQTWDGMPVEARLSDGPRPTPPP